MIFPPNNLPTASKNWAREVEKKVTNLESSFRSAEVNNTTRDSQLSVTANSALAAATQASAAAAAASQAAADAQAAATTANTAIAGLGSLDEESSTYKINAANITVGSLSGNRISGGVITGTLLNTASSGARIEMGTNNVNFYDDSGDFSGKIDAEGSGRGSTLNIDHQGLSGMFIYNGGLEMYANGPVAVNAQQLISYGSFSVTGNASVSGTLTAGSFSPSSLSTGSISCSSLSATGAVSGNTVSGSTVSASNFSGTVNTSIANNTTSSFAGNVFINTSGNMFRSTSTSSRDAKENIKPYEFDTESFISVNPVTFNYKPEAVSNPEESEISQLGFILEDFEEAGLGEHLVIPANELDAYKGLRYDKLYMFLHKVVQQQNETIKDLTARIEALESR